jgi:nicotinate-nucleotide adenylyltransferase
MKIGLLGGSFNPPHQGHIHISLEAKKCLDLKQIWWIPTKQNPLKAMVNGQLLMVNRVEGCLEITKNYPQILVKDLEKNIPSVYTIDLLRKIIKENPQHQFFWIIGADNVLQFHKWKNWREIIKLVPLIVCDRDEFFYKAVKSKAFLYAQKMGKIEFLRIKKSPESSTKIRNLLNK